MLFVSVLGVPSVHSVGTFFLQQIWNSTWEVVYRPFLPCHPAKVLWSSRIFSGEISPKDIRAGLWVFQPRATWSPVSSWIYMVTVETEVAFDGPAVLCWGFQQLPLVWDPGCLHWFFFVAGLGPGSQIRSFSVKYWDPSNLQPKGGGCLLSVHQGY